MAYATVDDLIARFGADEIAQRISNDPRVTGDLLAAVNAGDPSADAEPEAIEAVELGITRLDGLMGDAAELIDARIGNRYRLPLDKPPKALTRLACQLVRFDLYDDEAPETVRQRQKDALKLLDQISSGAASLGLPDLDQAATAGEPDYRAPERVFDRDGLRGF